MWPKFPDIYLEVERKLQEIDPPEIKSRPAGKKSMILSLNHFSNIRVTVQLTVLNKLVNVMLFQYLRFLQLSMAPHQIYLLWNIEEDQLHSIDF